MTLNKDGRLTAFLSIFILMSRDKVMKASSTLMLDLALVSRNLMLYSDASFTSTTMSSVTYWQTKQHIKGKYDSKPAGECFHWDIRPVCMYICTGTEWVGKSKLLILRKYVNKTQKIGGNKTQKIGGMWTNTNIYRKNGALSDIFT